mgnify:CR=1 FL=1
MYAELHCHSNYSFQEGASSVEDLLVRAKELGHQALAITDHDNLCGVMHFAQVARSVGVQAITGAEVTFKDGSHLTFLAETRQGYRNLCNLLSYSHIASDRRNPRLDPRYLPELAEGLILATLFLEPSTRAGRRFARPTTGAHVVVSRRVWCKCGCGDTKPALRKLQT